MFNLFVSCTGLLLGLAIVGLDRAIDRRGDALTAQRREGRLSEPEYARARLRLLHRSRLLGIAVTLALLVLLGTVVAHSAATGEWGGWNAYFKVLLSALLLWTAKGHFRLHTLIARTRSKMDSAT